MKKKWIYLSYELSDSLSAYGNGERIKIEQINSISQGKSSNNSLLQLPGHFATHIDFPFHFSLNGKSGSDYPAAFFVFSKIRIIDINKLVKSDLLIYPEDLKFEEPAAEVEFVIIKTGFSERRNEDAYWLHNYGFAPECAGYFKEKFPKLRAIGFDLISLTSYQHRDVGRIAHRAFLAINQICIVEDMDLSQINSKTFFHQIIIAPLRFYKADGSPVTVMAEISDEN
jgi:arylformamidase